MITDRESINLELPKKYNYDLNTVDGLIKAANVIMAPSNASLDVTLHCEVEGGRLVWSVKVDVKSEHNGEEYSCDESSSGLTERQIPAALATIIIKAINETRTYKCPIL